MERDYYQRELDVSKNEFILPDMERRDMAKITPPSVDFGMTKLDPLTWKEQVHFLRDKQKQVEKYALSKEYAEVNITSEGPVGIVLTSDWHLGANSTDYDLWEKHMDLIKNEESAYMIPLSNTIDSYVFTDGMFAELAHLPEQVSTMQSFVSDFKDKLLGVIGSSCHEGWVAKRTGLNVNQIMFMEALQDGVPFLDTGGMIDINVNDIKYTFGLAHKSRFHSSLNVTNANKRALDLRWPSADIIALAHHHVASLEHTERYEGRDRRDVVFVRTGTYKGISGENGIRGDGYSRHEGFGDGQRGGVMVVLDEKRKNIVPFFKLEDGMEYLKNLKELQQYRQTYGQ